MPDPKDLLANFAVPEFPLYLVGIFERGVTVYSQQIRALNLIWALVEAGTVLCEPDGATTKASDHKQIAIIGGGFAGLTAAAALIAKGAKAEITIFEHRDTLLPLQHGSDTRWLHPRIYNWPSDDSDSSVADLPILNWTAARASDVAAQIILGWCGIAKNAEKMPIIYCNAQHLQIRPCTGGVRRLTIEWVGDERRFDGSVDSVRSSVGMTKDFDHVILAIGYGLEKDDVLSYWRNDTLGQPSLAEPHRKYLVSGQGDGALIEVLRLRVSQYRQDRILDELFMRRSTLHSTIKNLHENYLRGVESLFSEFEKLNTDSEFIAVLSDLKSRLRRDTDVILHLKKRTMAELFDDPIIKIAFQNRLLIYMLYKCGGFTPTCSKIEDIVKLHGIPSNRIILRHGTNRNENLKLILSEDVAAKVELHFSVRRPQTEAINWPGGFFGFPGRVEATSQLDDTVRRKWRKEYLPNATALAASTLCAAVAGFLQTEHPGDARLRVTLHRTRMVGEEALLQQCCEYIGVNIQSRNSAARTFPAEKATIGLAYRCRRVVRSVQNVSGDALKAAATALDLHAGSSAMSTKVSFLLAIPIVQPEEVGKFLGPSPVAGVLYVDSEARGWFVNDDRVLEVVGMVEKFVRDTSVSEPDGFRRIRNRLPSAGAKILLEPASVPEAVSAALQIVGVQAPKSFGQFQLNFEYVDFFAA